MNKNRIRTYFARPDENKSDKENIDKIATEFLLWMAEEEEKKGNVDNAKRLRIEAYEGSPQNKKNH